MLKFKEIFVGKPCKITHCQVTTETDESGNTYTNHLYTVGMLSAVDDDYYYIGQTNEHPEMAIHKTQVVSVELIEVVVAEKESKNVMLAPGSKLNN